MMLLIWWWLEVSDISIQITVFLVSCVCVCVSVCNTKYKEIQVTCVSSVKNQLVLVTVVLSTIVCVFLSHSEGQVWIHKNQLKVCMLYGVDSFSSFTLLVSCYNAVAVAAAAAKQYKLKQSSAVV